MGKRRVRGVSSWRVITPIALLALCAPMGCVSRARPDREQSQLLYELGAKYYANRRIEAAIEELQKALKADPENADAYHMLGIISLKQGHDYLEKLATVSCIKGREAD